MIEQPQFIYWRQPNWTMSPPQPTAVTTSHGFGVRHQQTILLFLLLFFCNALRTNLSVGIVAMTDPTTNDSFEVVLCICFGRDKFVKSLLLFRRLSNGTKRWSRCCWAASSGATSSHRFPRVSWPSGSAQRCSSAAPLDCARCLPCSPTSPPTTAVGRWSWRLHFWIDSVASKVLDLLQWMCALRVLQGLTQGTIFPSTHTLLSKWVPPGERARLSTFVYSGIMGEWQL